jgi:hypothetical protein
MPRPFHFSHFTGIDGSILMSNDESRVATEQDMDRFFKVAEPELDRLTLEMGKAERAAGNPIPDWLLKAELMAFVRTRKRAAA